MESYRNVLANKFMRDTNYIIIKDTDDIEELDRQWELFNSQLTKRQQRLSDDRSIEIWDMTNQQHYEALRNELMNSIDADESEDYKNLQTFSFDTDDDMDDDEVQNLLNANLDDFEIPDDENDITEPVKEESIPLSGDTEIPKPKIALGINRDFDKDNQADQYEIDSNINIIGTIQGDDVEDYITNLDKSFADFNAQSIKLRKKSDDKCREIYGMSNLERYNKLKADVLNLKKPEKIEQIKPSDGEEDNLTVTKTEALGEFVSQVYQNMQVINEAESNKAKQHRRLNDTPYFTPSELIDMGVHGNHNYYCKDADNDGLITKTKVATWFDSYKDMCLDHIFEDHRKAWIDTLDVLYSDFEDIKQSGDEEKILARKQSILDLGWNPEIPFNRKNRLKASERVSKILDETIPKDIFINLDSIEDIGDDDELMQEEVKKSTHKPVLLIFTQGKTPIISQGIKLVTGSAYSHASISFDPELNEAYSYNMRKENFGFIKETLASFGNNIISVMAFFAPNKVVKQLKDKIDDFENSKTHFDLRIFLNKILHIDHKVSKNEYRQVCSTFVDTILKSGNINLVDDINIPDPGQLYTHAKSMPNKIIEVYEGQANQYDGKMVKRKINSLLKSGVPAINESKLVKNAQHLKDRAELDALIVANKALSKLTKDEKKKKGYQDNYENLKSVKSLTDLENVEESVQYITEEQTPIRAIPMTQETIDYYKDVTLDWGNGLDKVTLDDNSSGIIVVATSDFLPPGKEVKKVMGYVIVDNISHKITTLENGCGQRGMWSYLMTIAKYDLGAIIEDDVEEQYQYDNLEPINEGIGDLLNQLAHPHKYEAPLPSIAYSQKTGQLLPMTIRKYENIILPDEVWAKFNNDPFATKEGVYAIIFSPKNLRQINHIPKRKLVYQVAYCNDKNNVILVYEDLDRVEKYLKSKGEKLDVKPETYINIRISDKYCYINKKKNENYIKGTQFKDPNTGKIYETASILNEVKQFPVEFDKDGNLIIYKARIGSLSFGDEIADSVQLLESYRNTNNIEGIKYELAKIWYINDCIERQLKKRLSNDKYKELIDLRATCLNIFKLNLEFVMKAEKGFNFSDYYNSTPFSDNSIKISANTLKYTAKAITCLL